MKKNFLQISRTITALYTLFIIIQMMPEPARAEYILSNYERVVTSYAELKDALATDNGITTVYFGADITMTAGITVHSSKTNVVVSGLNPLDPDQTTPYTLTDYSSALQTYTIFINSSGIKSLLVSDLNIVGKNYYGTFSAYDTSVTNDLVITYQRVNYSGPQIIYHRRGLSHIIDCSVSINGANGGSESSEFAEAKHIKFEGKNTIGFQSVTWAVFWHTNTTSSDHGTFEVVDNSSLSVTANNRNSTSAAYGAYAALGGYVDITIGENAEFTIETSGSMNGLSSGSAAHFTSMTVRKGGAFNLTTTKAATTAVMQVNGDLSIADDASFIINGYGGSGYNLLQQNTGDIIVSEGASFHLATGGTYSALLLLNDRSFICNDPASVLLYNTNGRTIQAITTAGSLHIEAEQVNYWTSAGTGGLDDPPLYQWKKADGSNFIIDGTIAIGASGNFSSISSNFTDGDSPGSAPNAGTFSVVSARVLAFGRLELIIYAIDEESAAISGITAPGAAVRASYTEAGTDYVLPDTVADNDGFYSIPLESFPSQDTMVIVQSSFQYLSVISSTFVSPVEKLELSVPEYLSFNAMGISSGAQMARRADADWKITVSDTRGEGNGWRLYVKAPVPLTLAADDGFILNNALVFVDDTEAITPLHTTEKLLVYQHTPSTDNDITIIQWASDQGVLAHIPQRAVSGGYRGNLEWILADTP